VGLYDYPSVTIEAGWDDAASCLIDQSQPEVRVRLEGEFDASNSERLLEQLQVLVADSTVNLTLDLSRVGFFSASTVGVIVQLTEKFRQDDRRFTLVFPSPEVQRVFGACGLTAMLDRRDFNGGGVPPERSMRNVEHSSGDLASGSALASWVTVPKARVATRGSAEASQPTNPVPKHLARKPALVEGPHSGLKGFDTNSVGCGWF
jgi:anti-anti-sigma factor